MTFSQKGFLVCFCVLFITTPSLQALDQLEQNERIESKFYRVMDDGSAKEITMQEAIELLRQEITQIAPQTDSNRAIQAAKAVLSGAGGLIILGWLGGKLVLFETGKAAIWFLKKTGLWDHATQVARSFRKSVLTKQSTQDENTEIPVAVELDPNIKDNNASITVES